MKNALNVLCCALTLCFSFLLQAGVNENICEQLDANHSREIFGFPLWLSEELSADKIECAEKIVNQILDYDQDGQLNYPELYIAYLVDRGFFLRIHPNQKSAENTKQSSSEIFKQHDYHGSQDLFAENPGWQKKLSTGMAYYLAGHATYLTEVQFAIRKLYDHPEDFRDNWYYRHNNYLEDPEWRSADKALKVWDDPTCRKAMRLPSNGVLEWFYRELSNYQLAEKNIENLVSSNHNIPVYFQIKLILISSLMAPLYYEILSRSNLSIAYGEDETFAKQWVKKNPGMDQESLFSSIASSQWEQQNDLSVACDCMGISTEHCPAE